MSSRTKQASLRMTIANFSKFVIFVPFSHSAMTRWELKQRRAGRRGRQDAELAAEVLRSLFTGAKPEQQPPRRRPEWTCSCGVTNFTDTQACRHCSAARGGRQARVLERSVGKPNAQSKPDVRGLGQAAVAAEAAGASPAVLESLKKEATDQRSRAADARPVGSRLDSAKAAQRKAQKAVTDAKAAVTKANERLQESLLQMDAAQAQVDSIEEELRAERARPAGSSGLTLQPNLESTLRELLSALDSFQQVPDSIKDVHARARAALPALQPVEPQPQRADAPTALQEQRGRVRMADEASLGSGDETGAEDQTAQGGDDMLMELRDGEDDTDAALAALVRRLRGPRRRVA